MLTGSRDMFRDKMPNMGSTLVDHENKTHPAIEAGNDLATTNDLIWLIVSNVPVDCTVNQSVN